jgi:hypothetical protein
VGLVGVGIAFFARTAAFRESALLSFSFLALLALPGAADSLARCANDAAVFTWCCLILWTLQRRTPEVVVFFLLAVGPLLKPTALPIAAFAVCLLWRRGERRKAVIALTGALVVFPLQALRGWKWGGTYELNRPALALTEGLADIVVGFGRSIYTFIKTTAWLGGWSFFRAPRLLLVGYVVLGLCLLAAVRFRSHKEWIPHAAGLALAMVGFMVFALANRRFFGVWGGVGGWYVWGWFPWLLTAGFDLLTLRPVPARLLFGATVILVVATSLIYYWTAAGIYA